MWLFSKKQDGKTESPVGKAVGLAQQGRSDQEVATALRREGYSAPQVGRALAGAVKAGVVQPALPQPAQFQPMTMPEPQFQPGQTPQPSPYLQPQSSQYQQPEQPEQDFPVGQEEWTPPQEGMEEPMQVGFSAPSQTEMEEIVESVVEEKWKGVTETMEDVNARFDEVGKKLQELEIEVRTLKESGTAERGGIDGKLDEYKLNLDNINSRIGSIERAFKETLPSMIDSVKSITEVVERLKTEK